MWKTSSKNDFECALLKVPFTVRFCQNLVGFFWLFYRIQNSLKELKEDSVLVIKHISMRHTICFKGETLISQSYLGA